MIKRLETWDGRLVKDMSPNQTWSSGLDQEALELVRQALISAVEGPDATGALAQVEGLSVAGKTATSQVVSLDLIKGLEPEEIPIKFRDHALFAAFAPADDPEIVVVVVVEHAGAGGGAVAAPMAQQVLARYFDKNGYPGPLDEEQSVERPLEGRIDDDA